VSTLVEIEYAIEKLESTEFRLLLHRLKERDAQNWDQQMEEDAQNGKLDALYVRLTEGDHNQTNVPLDEVINNSRFSQASG
jgi:uncharacterized coiled-coil protein SlyX